MFTPKVGLLAAVMSMLLLVPAGAAAEESVPPPGANGLHSAFANLQKVLAARNAGHDRPAD
jgi:hypothetical protein